MHRLATPILGALTLLAGCALPLDESTADSDAQYLGLTGAARRPRAELIRDVAAKAGLTNGALLAGIAQVESGLSHCWSEATWACQGPYSSSCQGPVIAGAADGPCSAQQGGLGMFQFDGGNYAQTLARDGEGILLLEGNVTRAVTFVTTMVMRNVPGIDTAEQALTHLNAIPIAQGDSRFQAWNDLLACRYNGRCGSTTQAAKYADATLGLVSEFGSAFWGVHAQIPEEPGCLAQGAHAARATTSPAKWRN